MRLEVVGGHCECEGDSRSKLVYGVNRGIFLNKPKPLLSHWKKASRWVQDNATWKVDTMKSFSWTFSIPAKEWSRFPHVLVSKSEQYALFYVGAKMIIFSPSQKKPQHLGLIKKTSQFCTLKRFWKPRVFVFQCLFPAVLQKHRESQMLHSGR